MSMEKSSVSECALIDSSPIAMLTERLIHDHEAVLLLFNIFTQAPYCLWSLRLHLVD